VFPKHPVGYLSSLRATSLWLHRLTESLPGLHSRLRRYKTRKCKATPRLFINDSRDRKSGASDKRWVQLQRWKCCFPTTGLRELVRLRRLSRPALRLWQVLYVPEFVVVETKDIPSSLKKSLLLDPAASHFIRIFAVYIFLNFHFFIYDIFQAAHGVGFPRRITTKILY